MLHEITNDQQRHQIQAVNTLTLTTARAIAIPPPDPDPVLLLLAKWIGVENSVPDIYHIGRERHKYGLAVQPAEPVRVGRRVKILALSPIAYCSPGVPFMQYDTYDPHVVGTVADIVHAKDAATDGTRTMVIRITNECRGNLVSEVDVEMPHKCREMDQPEQMSRKRKRDGQDSPRRDATQLELLASVRPWPETQVCRGNICRLLPRALTLKF